MTSSDNFKEQLNELRTKCESLIDESKKLEKEMQGLAPEEPDEFWGSASSLDYLKLEQNRREIEWEIRDISVRAYKLCRRIINNNSTGSSAEKAAKATLKKIPASDLWNIN